MNEGIAKIAMIAKIAGIEKQRTAAHSTGRKTSQSS
jgi:hypothetical protein